MMAAWWPDWIAARHAETATTVFPDPTSPWSRTFIGRPAAIAAPTSSIARVWAFVGSNGSVASSRAVSSPSA